MSGIYTEWSLLRLTRCNECECGFTLSFFSPKMPLEEKLTSSNQDTNYTNGQTTEQRVLWFCFVWMLFGGNMAWNHLKTPKKWQLIKCLFAFKCVDGRVWVCVGICGYMWVCGGDSLLIILIVPSIRPCDYNAFIVIPSFIVKLLILDFSTPV